VDREDLDFLFFWMMSTRCWKHMYSWRSLCT